MTIVFIKSPIGTHQCFVVEYITNEKLNTAMIKVKGLAPSMYVTTRIEINDLKSFEAHKEVVSTNAHYKLMKPVHHDVNQGENETIGIIEYKNLHHGEK